MSDDLEKGVRMVMDAGLSSGHADNWLMLLEEVLDQHRELRERCTNGMTSTQKQLETLHSKAYDVSMVMADVTTECRDLRQDLFKVPKWQPIDTAPRDGQRIIIWVLHGGAWKKPGPAIASWTNDIGGFWDDGDSGVENAKCQYWYPLPEPPK